MARASTGGIRTKHTTRGTAYHARFRAYGQRREVLLGYSSDGMTPAIARQELQTILVDVRRGDWKPFSNRAPEEPVQAPTFHEFASEWMAARETAGLRPRTVEYLRWALVEHLLPEFASLRLDEFTIERVDRYASSKATEGRLSNRSINKTLDVLSSVLETAVEYEHLRANPARGRRRRLPVSKKPRSFLDTAEHISALLDATSGLDAAARLRRGQRRALLATLAFAGLRIGEALDLRWGDVNLAAGRLKVRDAKTAAGVRTVTLLPVLRDELLAYKAKAPDTSSHVLVFGTTTGGRQSETNVRRRILAPAVETASARLAKLDVEPLPERLTPHSLRRTFASILAALGEPMPSVIRQLGHTDPSLTLRIYAHDMARGEDERERLRALVEGRDWGTLGDNVPAEGADAPVSVAS
jgi:integrase